MAQLSNIKRYNDWVEKVRDTGGVHNDVASVVEAHTSASDVVWQAFEDTSLGERTSFAREGVKYIAAYMVHCAETEDKDLWDLAIPNSNRQVLFEQAAKSEDRQLVKDILAGAAEIAPSLMTSYLNCTGCFLQVNPNGSAKQVGTVRG